MNKQKDTSETIHYLHTIHGNFSDKEVASLDLRTFFDAGIYAANAPGKKSETILVAQDKYLMKRFFTFFRTVVKPLGGSVFLMLRYDFLMLIRSISGKDGNVDQGKISAKGGERWTRIGFLRDLLTQLGG